MLDDAFRLAHRTAPASWQMRADAALLAWVAGGPARLLFRTYSWERPTLSLGRTEPYPDGWNEQALAEAGVAVVRRPTGGSAVFHCDEMTFAVAASIPGPWNLTPRGFSDGVADCLADALRAAGIPAARVAAAAPGRRHPRGRAGLCFERSDAGEVNALGYKIAGLASRFSRGGALCHASVPLTSRYREIIRYRSLSGPPDLDQCARSLGEIVGAPPDPALISDRLASSLEARFGVAFLEGSFAMLGLEGGPVAGHGSESRSAEQPR